MESKTPGQRILIVEDDKVLAREMEQILSAKGYSVHLAADASQARAIGWRNIDFVLLDLNLPGVNGRVLCREICDTSKAGIIIVSSNSDLVDRVSLLELGADDFITKPFEPAELTARIRAVLRRRAITVSNRGLEAFGPWRFSGGERQLQHEDGHVVTLTSSEAKLLRHLTDNPGLVFSREELLAISRTRQHAGVSDRSVDNLVKRLRRKIELDADDPHFILSVWGRGYMFQAD